MKKAAIGICAVAVLAAAVFLFPSSSKIEGPKTNPLDMVEEPVVHEDAPTVKTEPKREVATTSNIRVTNESQSYPSAPSATAAAVGKELTAGNIFAGVNVERQKIGLASLRRNAQLDAAAKLKLDDMLAKNYFAHQSPDGHGHQYWIAQSGYVGTYEGENLARFFKTTPETIAGWVASPTHYANISKAQYTETGIAVSGSYVVQLFATPK